MDYGKLALVVMAAFTGAALYINMAEHPARRALPEGAMLVQWKHSYKRAVVMQAGLALIGAILGVVAYFHAKNALFITGAIFALANWVVTFKWIMPVNRRLLAVATDMADADTRRLLDAWNRLHAGRTLLGLLATACFFMALP